MRHLRSLLYAVVLAPAVWVLCGVGVTRDLTERAQAASGVVSFTALLLLLLAGAAYAILVFAPISPLGPVSAGVVFLAAGLWAMHGPDSYASVWPAGVTKEGFDLSRPGYALAVLLAVPMLVTALSARRWARYEPPQLAWIGTVGRFRGAAPVAGTPVAAERTEEVATPAWFPAPGANADDVTTVISRGATGSVPDGGGTAGASDRGAETQVIDVAPMRAAGEPAQPDPADGQRSAGETAG